MVFDYSFSFQLIFSLISFSLMACCKIHHSFDEYGDCVNYDYSDDDGYNDDDYHYDDYYCNYN